MKKTIFTKYAVVALLPFFLLSCDKDFNTIGSDIIEGENYTFTGEPFGVIAYNQKVTAVQTNGLVINQLGISNDDVFGKTVANFATQLQLTTPDPTFGENIEIDSVVLNIPYFSKVIKTESSGLNRYSLDSIYTTDPTSANDANFKPINLKVYRSGYQLNDFDPNNLEVAQKYYSDQDANFSSQVVGGMLNNSSNPKENVAFVPDAKEILRFKVKSEKNTTNPNFYVMEHTRTTDVEARRVPSMRLHLDKDYFMTNIIETAASNLANNNNFKRYFKGLYFQVQDANAGTMMNLDFSKGSIVIYYKEDLIVTKTTTVGGVTTTVNVGNDRPLKEFGMLLSGISVNLYNNSSTPPGYANSGVTPDRDHGDPNLYLKGRDGSMAIIEIFKDPVKLQELKDKEVLVNDASLYFTVNKNLMRLEYEPLRVYLFDVDNNKVIYDYTFDGSSNSTYPKRNKFIFGGILEKVTMNDDTEKMIYRIRITEHVSRILKGKQENVRLGLVVTDNINNAAYGSLKNPPSSGGAKVLKTLPVASVMSPEGTVLYGNVPGDNSIDFRINYTEPNN